MVNSKLETYSKNIKYYWHFYISPLLRGLSPNSKEDYELRIERIKLKEGGRCFHSYQQARSDNHGGYLYSAPFCDLNNTWCDCCEFVDKKQGDCPDYGGTIL